jgi:hypothetical protein
LSYINEILDFFERERRKVEESSKSKIESISPKITAIRDKIDFMETVQASFMKYLGKLKLESDEQIVYYQPCKLASGKNTDDAYSNKGGTIMLTSKRLYFLHEQGLFRKQTVVLFRVLIEDIQSAGVTGKLVKKLSLESLNSMYNFKLRKDDRDKLLNWIERARKFATHNQIDRESWQQLNRAKINSSMFQEQLEQAIYKLIGFRGSNSQSGRQSSNQIVNEKMFHTRHLPQQNHPMNSTNFTRKSTHSNHSFFRQASGPSTKINRMRTQGGHFGYPHDKYPDQESNFNRDNTISFSQRSNSSRGNTQHRNPNLYNPSYQSSNNQSNYSPYNSYNQDSRYGNRQSFSNFTGHQKVPDQSWRRKIQFNQPNPSSNYGFAQNFEDYGNNSSDRYGSQDQNISHTYFGRKNSEMGSSAYNNPDNNPDMDSQLNNHPFAPSSSRSDDFHMGNQEFQLKTSIENFRQEQFALQNTIQTYERSFNAGKIPHSEFLKNFQEMQKDLFKITSHIKELEIAIQQNYSSH